MDNQKRPSALYLRLKRAGWTTERALEEPEEKWPVPSPPYPPNRWYHFLNDRSIAVIVDAERHEIIGSVPGGEAWATVQQYNSPDIDDDIEGRPVVMKNPGHGGWVTREVDLSAPWTVQVITSREGTWTVHGVSERSGGVILLNQEVITSYEQAFELEGREDIPQIILEAAWLIQNKGKY